MNSLNLGEKILDRIKVEDEKYIPQKAQGCVILEVENQTRCYWLIKGSLNKSRREINDITGTVQSVIAGPDQFFKLLFFLIFLIKFI